MNMAEIIRALTRPVLTLTGLVGLIIMLLTGASVPEYYIIIVAGMLAWWFGERTVRHIEEDKNENARDISRQKSESSNRKPHGPPES